MPASARLSDLATRKRLLVGAAEVHRETFGGEQRRLRGRCEATCGWAGKHRWWLLGGAVVAGLLLASRWRRIARAIPTVVSWWRDFR